jgi:hypothetical protein
LDMSFVDFFAKTEMQNPFAKLLELLWQNYSKHAGTYMTNMKVHIYPLLLWLYTKNVHREGHVAFFTVHRLTEHCSS